MKTGTSRNIASIAAALSLALALAGAPASAQMTQRIAKNASRLAKFDPAQVSLDQKLNSQVPLDATFRDELGRTVRLRDYFHDRPVVLNMIFYKCPGVCMAELDGMTALFNDKGMTLEPGKDFEVVTISINPNETPEIALRKKQEYMALLRKPADAPGWHFLVGDLPNIDKVAGAIGFRYAYDARTDQFAHPAGIILLTPKGRVSRYFYSVNYSPRDVRLSLIAAAGNKIGSLTDRILGNCIYQYDPKTGRYGLAIMRLLQITGCLTVLTLGTCIFILSRLYTRQPLKPAPRPPSSPVTEN